MCFATEYWTKTTTIIIGKFLLCVLPMAKIEDI